MKKSLILLILLIYCFNDIFPQGLKFKGNEYIINNRTSYNVFGGHTPTFRNYLEIGFDILFSEPSNLGYILRIKDNEQNITYNLSYNRAEEKVIFKFNMEGRINLITTNFSSNEIEKNRWHKITLFFDLKNNLFFMTINEKQVQLENLLLPDKWRPAIVFGKSDYIIDVPSFAIKNLIIKDNNTNFTFLLNESQGELVSDKKGKVYGNVKDPVWLINDSYYWKLRNKFQSQKVAGSNFNIKTQDIYYFNEDSIICFNVATDEVRTERYNQKSTMSFKLGTNFIDTFQNRLYAYEVYTPPAGDVTISAFELDNNNWEVVSKQLLPRQLHHHAGFFDIENNRYIIYGGFGTFRYSKDFYSFDIKKCEWDTLFFKGDVITPRYFISMGNLKGTNKLYLFGGMGNESGDQTVGRTYHYDFYEINLDSLHIKKLWELSQNDYRFVPVRGMIVDDSNFYTLCYKEYLSESYLKLYRFSIKDGSFETLGDSIPIRSEKINTNANLYLNERFNEIYAIVQEFDDDDIASELTIYSLSFPSISSKELFKSKDASIFRSLWLIIPAFLIFLTVIFYIFQKIKPKPVEKDDTVMDQNKNTDSILQLPQKEKRANAIYLFGDFSVRDKNKREISYMFSTKIKQTFCVILQYSLKDGITSQHLSEILWAGKNEEKIKNLRGVTINNLRKILNELSGINLVYEKGVYKFIFSDDCYCDFKRCIELISENSSETPDSQKEFITILSRGKFLKSDDSPVLDSFKHIVEYELEPVLMLEIEKSFSAERYKTTIRLSEAVFNIDPVNEKAISFLIRSLLKLKMHDEAKKRFMQFSTEYKLTFGEDFSKSFTEICNSKNQM